MAGAISIRIPGLQLDGPCRTYVPPDPDLRDTVIHAVRQATISAIAANEGPWMLGLHGHLQPAGEPCC